MLVVSSGSDASESETLLPDLLEQLAELWQINFPCPDALHQLFAPLTVTAVLQAADSQVDEEIKCSGSLLASGPCTAVALLYLDQVCPTKT